MGSMRFEFSRLFGVARELHNIFSYVMHKNVHKVQLLYLTDETLVVLFCTASKDTSLTLCHVTKNALLTERLNHLQEPGADAV